MRTGGWSNGFSNTPFLSPLKLNKEPSLAVVFVKFIVSSTMVDCNGMVNSATQHSSVNANGFSTLVLGGQFRFVVLLFVVVMVKVVLV